MVFTLGFCFSALQTAVHRDPDDAVWGLGLRDTKRFLGTDSESSKHWKLRGGS